MRFHTLSKRTKRFNVQQKQSRLQTELIAQRTNHISTTLNQHMSLFGYRLINLHTIDDLDLFLVKAGDQIISSLFAFERQGKQYALRPEFTASAANYFAKTDGSAVARWQFAGTVFEDNFTTPNANYERLSIGAELIGLQGSLADAEIIAMSAAGLDKLEISDYHITIGHIGFIRELLRQFEIDSRTERFLLHQIGALSDRKRGKEWVFEQFITQLVSSRSQVDQTNNEILIQQPLVHELNSPVIASSLPTVGGRTKAEIARRIQLKRQRYVDKEKVLTAIDFLHRLCQIVEAPTEAFKQLAKFTSGNINADELLRGWGDTISVLDAHGIPLSRITIKPSLARSWEYYTGIVFELHNKDLHLGGGGRYDELIRLIGTNADVPSVGFAYYGDRLVDIISSEPEEPTKVVTLISQSENMVQATKWAKEIRSYGISIQILPDSLSAQVQSEILLLEDTSVWYKDSKFTIQQIDLLINQLRQIQQ